jgi:predicted protein tyrosine phosphatase
MTAAIIEPGSASLPASPDLCICGIEELPLHGARGVTHVLSLVDPELAELEAFSQYADHHRVTLRFHDIIEPGPGRTMPTEDHVNDILRFGEMCADAAPSRRTGGLLVHCHMGVSRSTAAMLTLMAQAHPDRDEDHLFGQLRDMRPQAWPNSRMIRFADDALGRGGRLFAGLRRHYGVQLAERPELGRWMVELGRKTEVDLAF